MSNYYSLAVFFKSEGIHNATGRFAPFRIIRQGLPGLCLSKT